MGGEVLDDEAIARLSYPEIVELIKRLLEELELRYMAYGLE